MNKRIIPIIAGTVVISATALMAFSNKAIAKTGIVYNVETGLLIRETPDKNANILDSLLNGAGVEVIGEEGNYYKIKYNGITGYVTKSYVNVDGEVPKTETKTETKTENKVENTATETKTEEKVENKVEENKTENTTTNTTTTTTTTETKTTSSFRAKLLDKAKVFVLPLVNTSKLGEIEKDKEVTVISKTGNWCYVQTDSISGWIFTSRVEKVDTPVEKPAENNNNSNNNNNNNSTSNKKMYVAFEYCNVRESATTDSAKVTSANHNTEVEILGKEGEWYKVNVNGKTGYIREDQLSESQT